MSTEFDSYFTALTVGNNKRNPWFSEYWEKVFDCSMTRTNHTGRRRCTGTYGRDQRHEQAQVHQYVR